MISKKLIGAGGNGGLNLAEFLDVSEYTGDDPTDVDVVNTVNLSTNEGVVIFDDGNGPGGMFDTANGGSNYVTMNNNSNENTGTLILTFNTNGITLDGADSTFNESGNPYTAFTFRSGSKFFDVVEFTGTGATQVVPHNLDVAPGMIALRGRDDGTPQAGDAWEFYHRFLNSGTTPENFSWRGNNDETSGSTPMTAAPTDTGFTVAKDSGVRYTALLFAHNDAPSGQIVCGGYTGNGSLTGPVVTLGWEPQMVMIKAVSLSGGFLTYDNFRNASNPRTRGSRFWTGSNERTSGRNIDFLSTGFQIKSTDTDLNVNTERYVYVAIRS